MDNFETPKLFISYSWSFPDHENWVEELARELVAAGVHVILDKWDLKEGQEANAFMEQMVSDPTVDKVILICDKLYAEKANGRQGGVGTEAQIISSEIYRAHDQTKFVAIVREYNEQGKPCVPKYYTSRIYIDLSDSPRYAMEFERLVRWIYNQPLSVRPPLGKKPSYLIRENKAITLTTSAEHRRAIDAIKNARTYADAAISDYLMALAEGIEQFRIEKQEEVHFDDQVVHSIEDFLPYRNEALELFITLARYRDTSDARRALHRFFEQLLPYQDRPHHITHWSDNDFDNFRFIIHELFLYGLAALLREEKFDFANSLLQTPFYLPGRSDYGRDTTVDFQAFYNDAGSFEARNARLKLNKLSLRAILLNERSQASGFNFRDLMQADFVLFMRNLIVRPGETFRWFPETLIYAGRHSGPFEIFARSRSAGYFKSVKPLLGLTNIEQLSATLSGSERDLQRIPEWGYKSFNSHALLGFEQLGTLP